LNRRKMENQTRQTIKQNSNTTTLAAAATTQPVGKKRIEFDKWKTTPIVLLPSSLFPLSLRLARRTNLGSQSSIHAKLQLPR